MQKYLILLLSLLVGCTATNPVIKTPGLNYKNDGIKIALDVANIEFVNAYQEPEAGSRLLPKSVAPYVEEWAKTRFIAMGNKGTATIKIINAAINEKNLVAPNEVNRLLNTEEEDMEYGVNLSLEIIVQDSPAYKEGKINTSLSRHVTLDSDVLLGFNPVIWQDFSERLINSLDNQVKADINTYLPNLLTSNATRMAS